MKTNTNPPHLVGGDLYYTKYLKYKQKYITLKNQLNK